jgi:hypothetical protein
MKMSIMIIVCLLMFSFFLTVTGRNLPSPPPSPDVNFDAPPVQLTLPPPSPIINIGDVYNDIINIKNLMDDSIMIALVITIVLFFQTCIRLVQTCIWLRS